MEGNRKRHQFTSYHVVAVNTVIWALSWQQRQSRSARFFLFCWPIRTTEMYPKLATASSKYSCFYDVREKIDAFHFSCNCFRWIFNCHNTLVIQTTQYTRGSWLKFISLYISYRPWVCRSCGWHFDDVILHVLWWRLVSPQSTWP